MISVAAVLIIQAVTNSPLLAGNPNRDIPVFIVIAPIVLLRTGGIQTYPIKYCLADVELNFTFLATVIVPIAGIGFIKTKIAIVGIAGNDSNLLIVFYVQIMPDDFVMQLHRF